MKTSTHIMAARLVVASGSLVGMMKGHVVEGGIALLVAIFLGGLIEWYFANRGK